MDRARDVVPHPAGRWRLRERLAALFFVAFLVGQVAIPVRQLTDPRGRFGWQMYASVRPGPHYLVDGGSGQVDTVFVADHVARNRPEVDYPSVLPAYLCRVGEGRALAVVVAWPDGTRERRPCR